MSKVTHRDLRQGIIRTCREMNRIGLNQGTSGNLSHRIPEGMLITPTSLPYDDMSPKDIVEMAFDGTYVGRHRPSSEWRFHRDILKNRSDVNVVLHTHSTYSTTLAVHEKAIPAFHYMVAVAGGTDIRCSPYACFGTQELSDAALAALDGRLACLLGHHGLIVLADSLEKALWRAVEVETLAKMYVHALAIGEPPRLTQAEMEQVIEQIRRMSYGQAPDLDAVGDTPKARRGKVGEDESDAPSAASAEAPPPLSAAAKPLSPVSSTAGSGEKGKKRRSAASGGQASTRLATAPAPVVAAVLNTRRSRAAARPAASPARAPRLAAAPVAKSPAAGPSPKSSASTPPGAASGRKAKAGKVPSAGKPKSPPDSTSAGPAAPRKSPRTSTRRPPPPRKPR